MSIDPYLTVFSLVKCTFVHMDKSGDVRKNAIRSERSLREGCPRNLARSPNYSPATVEMGGYYRFKLHDRLRTTVVRVNCCTQTKSKQNCSLEVW